jgi:hypothetical protein
VQKYQNSDRLLTNDRLRCSVLVRRIVHKTVGTSCVRRRQSSVAASASRTSSACAALGSSCCRFVSDCVACCVVLVFNTFRCAYSFQPLVALAGHTHKYFCGVLMIVLRLFFARTAASPFPASGPTTAPVPTPRNESVSIVRLNVRDLFMFSFVRQ